MTEKSTEQAAQLPEGFRNLEPFLFEWGGLETQDQRYLQRQKLPIEDLHRYYDAVAPRLEEILIYLDSFTYGEPLPESEALLP